MTGRTDRVDRRDGVVVDLYRVSPFVTISTGAVRGTVRVPRATGDPRAVTAEYGPVAARSPPPPRAV